MFLEAVQQLPVKPPTTFHANWTVLNARGAIPIQLIPSILILLSQLLAKRPRREARKSYAGAPPLHPTGHRPPILSAIKIVFFVLPAGQLLPATLTVRKLEVLLRSQGHHEMVPARLTRRELVVWLRSQGHHEMVPARLTKSWWCG